VNFADRVVEAVRRVGNPIIVGIDPRPEELPAGFLDRFPSDVPGVAEAIRTFGREVVDVVAPLVPAVKFQSAFYEAYGPSGIAALHDTVEHAREKGLIVIFDGKRNDIGSTAEAYARAYLGKVMAGNSYGAIWHTDAITVNPYLGSDGILPFVKSAAREGKGLFVLIRTSNPSAGEFQDLVADGKAIYQHVADHVAEWAAPYRGESGYSLVGAVVGATAPEQLAELRAALPGVLFLVPGYGHQGGTAHDVASAFDENGLGALINNSRGITYAYARPASQAKFGDRWLEAVENAVREMSDDLAAHTTTARLRTS
jgi:orotidine-5'-phosphate decarboxylase